MALILIIWTPFSLDTMDNQSMLKIKEETDVSIVPISNCIGTTILKKELRLKCENSYFKGNVQNDQNSIKNISVRLQWLSHIPYRFYQGQALKALKLVKNATVHKKILQPYIL